MKIEQIQNTLYNKLLNAGINEITARYIAMRLQKMKATDIKTIKKKEHLKYEVTTDMFNYFVILHELGIPDAEIFQLD